MIIKAANKHEIKTRETRALLLAAAETIFVRDGYEGSELGEIAALAGRTKGAIYAQFKSKEDIFIALIEDRALRYRMQIEKALSKSTSVAGNMAALREFYLQRAEDHGWALLLLEFKLFAMRHPELKKRLKNLYAGMLTKSDEKRLAGILGAASAGKDAVSRVIAIEAMYPVICGLVLEAQLETNLSEEGVLEKVTNRIFDTLLDASVRKPRSSSQELVEKGKRQAKAHPSG